jgi:predicted transcriptional regulator
MKTEASLVQAVISIKPQHVFNILAGTKSIELRRKTLNLPIGTRLWIYSTLPSGRFEAYATLEEKITGSPEELRYLSDKACVTKQEYDDYFRNSDKACALRLANVNSVKPGADLYNIRKLVDEAFHPPQFFFKTTGNSPLVDFLAQHTHVLN